MQLANFIIAMTLVVGLLAAHYYFYIPWVCRPLVENWVEELGLDLIEIARPPFYLIGPCGQFEVHRGRAVLIVTVTQYSPSTEKFWVLCSTGPYGHVVRTEKYP